jgi:hypothetical protein
MISRFGLRRRAWEAALIPAASPPITTSRSFPIGHYLPANTNRRSSGIGFQYLPIISPLVCKLFLHGKLGHLILDRNIFSHGNQFLIITNTIDDEVPQRFQILLFGLAFGPQFNNIFVDLDYHAISSSLFESLAINRPGAVKIEPFHRGFAQLSRHLPIS